MKYFLLMIIPFMLLEYGVSTTDETKRLLLTDPEYAGNQQLHKDVETLKATVAQLQTTVTQLMANKNGGQTGSVYIRWGRKECPGNGTEMVYPGMAGGGYYGNPGRNSNPVCVPHDPDLGPLSSEGTFGTVHGIEYQTNAFGSNLIDKDVPCAVCRVKDASSILMIPGRSRCYAGWKTEYTGNLMSGHYGHAGASHSICVDAVPDVLEAGTRHENGYLLYVVKAYCGSLKCPPYVQDSTFIYNVNNYIFRHF